MIRNYLLAVTFAGVWYGHYNNEYRGVVVIPEEVALEERTLKVTCIEISAFDGCHELTSITIPQSVTNIGESPDPYYSESPKRRNSCRAAVWASPTSTTQCATPTASSSPSLRSSEVRWHSLTSGHRGAAPAVGIARP